MNNAKWNELSPIERYAAVKGVSVTKAHVLLGTAQDSYYKTCGIPASNLLAYKKLGRKKRTQRS